MIRSVSTCALVFCMALVLTACGAEPGDTPSAKKPAKEGATTWVLAADLPEAKTIFDAKELEAGATVAVYGRVRDIADGFLAFTLIDEELEYCGQENPEDDHCPTPWDYCCKQSEARAMASLPIEIRDEKGEPVEGEASELRLLDMVAIQGVLTKTESGGLMLVAKEGWFRRERPKMGAHVKWPE